MNKCTGFILAGGKSSRMGFDKAFIKYNGKTFIEFSIEKMKNICQNVLINSNNPEIAQFNLPIIRDIYPNVGPLAGIHACLKLSTTQKNIFMACDTPFIDENIYKKILEISDSCDAVVLRHPDGKIEPLIAYYSKNNIAIIESQIEKGQNKIQDLLKIINTRFVDIDNNFSTSNFNTTEDLNKLLNFEKIQ